MAASSGVVVEGLKKHFYDRKRGRVQAVDGVSFEARPGEIFALLGPNGAGKTTTLRILATVLQPDSGRVLMDGVDALTHPEEARRRLGFHPGDAGVYHRLTPREMVEIFGRLRGMDGATLRQRMDEVFTRLGLQEIAGQQLGKLSTGQRQKAAVARLWVMDPPVWILDEPALGLDLPTTRVVEESLLEARDRGRTVILSTHIMEQAEYLADRIGVIHRGRLVALGTMEDLRRRTGKQRLREVFLALLNAQETSA